LRDHPQVGDLAYQAKQRLSAFGGLHFTPPEWLHMTTLCAGSADGFTPGQLQQMIRTAGQLLTGIPPITVGFGRVLYHPEAIMLAVEPAEAVAPLHTAAETATAQVSSGRQDAQSSSWMPHVTICYSTSSQPAGPIISALGKQLPSRQIQISALSLVIQHGPERDWSWTTIGGIQLPAPGQPAATR
jgi:2'-5' RNA ligase